MSTAMARSRPPHRIPARRLATEAKMPIAAICLFVADAPAQQLAIQRLAIQSEDLRCIGAVAVAGLEDAQHVAALDLLEGEQLGQLGARHRGRTTRITDLVGEVFHYDLLELSQRHGTLP